MYFINLIYYYNLVPNYNLEINYCFCLSCHMNFLSVFYHIIPIKNSKTNIVRLFSNLFPDSFCN